MVALVGCAAPPANSSKCLKSEAGFCVGTVAAPFEITIREAVKNIDGSLFVVSGKGRTDPNSRFVAIVRPLDAPDLVSVSDLRQLCKVSKIGATECGDGGIKTARYFYHIQHSRGGYSYKHGIRVDLLSSSAVPRDFVARLIYPCAVMTDEKRACGPNLGTCIEWGASDRCDFRDDLWSDLRKWWDRRF